MCQNNESYPTLADMNVRWKKNTTMTERKRLLVMVDGKRQRERGGDREREMKTKNRNIRREQLK